MSDDDLTRQDEYAMRIALDQAHNAWLVGEVPVGAAVVRHTEQGPQVIATGYNRPVTTHDPTAHAEIVALRHAAQLLENYRLPDCDVYVTLEPCAMCAMALMHARVRRVVFGAYDPKTGAAGSVVDLFASTQLNHHTAIEGGVMADACGKLLREFFAERRAQRRAQRAVETGEGIEVVEVSDFMTLQAAEVGDVIEGVTVYVQSELPAVPASNADEPIPVGLTTEIDPNETPR